MRAYKQQEEAESTIGEVLRRDTLKEDLRID